MSFYGTFSLFIPQVFASLYHRQRVCSMFSPAQLRTNSIGSIESSHVELLQSENNAPGNSTSTVCVVSR